MFQSRIPCVVGLVLALTGCIRTQAVLVVDDGGGPGVGFTSIQNAVTAATDGDVILVRPGAYAAFTIDAKALTLIADGGRPEVGRFVLGSLTMVCNLASWQHVTVRGFDLGSVDVRDCFGSVWFEDANVQGTATPVAAFEAVNASCVSISSSTITGLATYCALQPTSPCTIGTPGLSVEQFSDVAVHDSTITGGMGTVALPAFAIPATQGFAGAQVVSGRLRLSGSTVRGGAGGTGAASTLAPACAPGGDGGPGLVNDAGGEVWTHDTLLAGGLGGLASNFCGPVANNAGVNGQAVVGAAPNGLAGFAPRLVAPTPAREGGIVVHRFVGAPGDQVFAAVAINPSHETVPGAIGILLVRPAIILPLGAIPASGEGVAVQIVPNLGPGVLAVPFRLQTAHLSAAGTLTLTNPSACVWLDQSL